MSDRDQFGPRLRRERERRGITLEKLAAVTKVSVDLWDGMERNDFSRWPSGIFARAFVRDYARTIGLDADGVVDDFCRQFDIGDRRGARIVEAQGELIGHQVQRAPDAEPLPTGRERRSGRRAAPPPPALRVKYAPRAFAAAIDVAAVCGLALLSARIGALGFWTAAGPAALTYHIVSTVVVGASLGNRAVDVMSTYLPALSLHTARKPARIT
jgi:transcriptional regulator with XRE-family HTH domain